MEDLDTFSYRIELGGNYALELICTREAKSHRYSLLMSILIDCAHINELDQPATYTGLLVSLDATTSLEAVSRARKFLINKDETDKIYHKLLNPEIGEE